MPSTPASAVGLIRLTALAALCALAAFLGIAPSEPAGAAPKPFTGPPENGTLIGSHDFDGDGIDDDLYAVAAGNTADPRFASDPRSASAESETTPDPVSSSEFSRWHTSFCTSC